MKYVVIFLILAGCAEINRGLSGEPSESQRQAMLARYGQRCSELGFTANTDTWRNCILQLRQQAIQLEQADSARQGKTCYRDALGVSCY